MRHMARHPSIAKIPLIQNNVQAANSQAVKYPGLSELAAGVNQTLPKDPSKLPDLLGSENQDERQFVKLMSVPRFFF